MVKVVKTRVEFEGRFRDEYVTVEGEELQPWSPKDKQLVVGKGVSRIDGSAKVTGSAKYTHDVFLPGMLYGRFLRSPYAHAMVKRIDASEALKIPGVQAIYTSDNASKLPFQGAEKLLRKELMFQGDEVALVVASDEATLEDALDSIKVDYEPLKPVIDPEKSLSEDQVKLNKEGNLSGGSPKLYERGDVEKGFKEADVIVEETFRTQAALHNCMETHGSVAYWEADNLIVYTSTQSVADVRAGLSEALGVPTRKIRVISPYMGGGFGSKFGAGKYTVFAAMASKVLGKPVRIILDRIEENLATGNRSQTVQKIKIGAKKDGSLTAIYMNAVVNVGLNGWVADLGGPLKMIYQCPNVKVELFGARTNLVSSTAFRAPGYVEGNFGLESTMDELAHKLGMDPLELRLRNYAERDQTMNLPYSSKGLREAYLKGADIVDWFGSPRVLKRDGKIRAKGMASLIWWGGGGPPAYAQVKINSDASATVITSTQDIGTGTRTALAQIAAEELSIPVEKLSVILGDTVNELFSPGSGGSQTLASIGPAVRSAAYDAKNQLLDIASQVLDVAKDSLELRAGKIARKGGETLLSIEELLEKFGNFTVTGKGSRGPNDDRYMVNTFGAQFAEVEVDTDTGEVNVLRLVSVHESGKIINPLLLSSQIEGGVIQGMGYALWEGRLVDKESGVVLNPNLNDYLVPRSTDINAVEAYYVEPEDANNNLGAKGIGEPPIVGVAPAIANAVRAALGIRLRQLPITSEQIYRALHGLSDRDSQAAYY
jgi:CO/xanthine dehydrogenase Mo-binding subunit